MINEPAPSALDTAAAVRAGRSTATAVTEAALARIVRLNPALNAIIAGDADRALAQAAEVDERVAGGAHLPLAGVPLAVKDTEDTVGYRTTYGSRLFADNPFATDDSVLVARLRAAGCVVVGKSNTPEFATSADTSNLVFGSTRNPYAPDRLTGGSSGGAAAAVASGMVPLATASDGGGSIRIPASACGLPGFKPSLGRVPDGGPHPVDWPLVTTRGVITRTVADLVATLDVVVGPERTDLRSLPAPCVPFSVGVDGRRSPPGRLEPVAGLRLDRAEHPGRLHRRRRATRRRRRRGGRDRPRLRHRAVRRLGTADRGVRAAQCR